MGGTTQTKGMHMSFDPVIQAIKDDPALAAELQAAPTPAARAAILDARGIQRPTMDSQFPEMDDTAGAGTTTDVIAAANATAMAA